jgi:hypothetical protein
MSEPGSNNMILMIWLSLAFAGLLVVGSLVVMIVILNAYAPSQLAAIEPVIP